MHFTVGLYQGASIQVRSRVRFHIDNKANWLARPHQIDGALAA
jgi:hypothetical protein